jgi:hypothetical protein
MEPRLQSNFRPLERMLRRGRLRWKLAVCWIVAAGVCVLLYFAQVFSGIHSPWLRILTVAGAVVAAFIIWRRESRRRPDFRAMASAIEREDPEARYLVSAALEQEPDPRSGQFAFLQWRVIDQVLAHSRRPLWERSVHRRFTHARLAQLGSLGLFLAAILFLERLSSRQPAGTGLWFSTAVTVSPGDIQVERRTSLVISARFGRKPPPEAMLVLRQDSGVTNRIPMQRELADPVFASVMADVAEGAFYSIEYGGHKTREYRIRVFDFPEVLRGDATLVFPPYTGLTNKTIPDTRRLSAVEGTQLTYVLHLNKPVVRARFLGHASPLNLALETNATARLTGFTLTTNAQYALELLDAEGRTNKVPMILSIQVLANRRPDLKVIFPQGDPRVSRLEELQIQAQASDDFGLLKYGIGFGVAGRDPQFIELGQSAAPNEKRQFSHVIALEKLDLEPDQVLSYFVWGDDYGPDGQMRRTFSDIFFAEVRPFEEIFRANQSGGGGGQGQAADNDSAQLAQMQKQIAIATWKLKQEKAPANPSAPGRTPR